MKNKGWEWMLAMTLPVALHSVAGAAQLSPAAAKGAVQPASQPATQPAAELDPPVEKEFKSAYDQSVQKYLLLLSKNFNPRAEHDLLLAFHGHGSDRNQYARDPRGECKGARDVAARHNLIYVSPDYRAPAGWMGPAAEADTVQLIAELKKLFKVKKTFLVGGSMGGTAVLTFTALHPKLVDGVSSQNGMGNLLEYEADFAGIQEAIKTAFGGRKDETPAQYKQRNPAEYRKRSAELHPEQFTMPVAITVGNKDTVVPPQSVLRLAEKLKTRNPNVLVIERPEGGHATSYEDTVTALEFVLTAAAESKPSK